MEIDAIYLRLIGICLVLLAFGLIYARIIAQYPFMPRRTWQSVVFGDFTTAFGAGAIILLFTENLLLAMVPLFCLVLTGGPMIMGQEIKHALQDGGEVIPEEDEASVMIEALDGD